MENLLAEIGLIKCRENLKDHQNGSEREKYLAIVPYCPTSISHYRQVSTLFLLHYLYYFHYSTSNINSTNSNKEHPAKSFFFVF